MLKIGFAKEIITPPHGADLAGYFNHRYVDGVLDDLFVRAMIIEQDGKKAGFIVFDWLNNAGGLEDQVRQALNAQGFDFADNVIISSTHSHTATAAMTDEMPSRMGVTIAIEGAARAMKRALFSMLSTELYYAEADKNPYAFVRRYFMKGGYVATNPTRCNPDIIGPETDFDQHIRIVGLKQGGELTALIVNLANHCDTVGGTKVSADWPGRMEAAIQYALKRDIPVFPMTDASGNINHFKVHENIDQTNYDEAVRIGRGYAEIVVGLLDKMKKIPEGEMEIQSDRVFLPHRVISKKEYEKAQKYLEDTKNVKLRKGDITSEGLTNGDVLTLRFFAQSVLDCHDYSTKGDDCMITRISFGKQLAFISLPGEPFNDIAQAIRKASPYKRNIVVELAQSYGEYYPMKECFARGGYEAQPGIDSAAPGAAEILIEASIKNLKKNPKACGKKPTKMV